MTIDDVRRRVENIRQTTGDPEVAHGMEDRLYRDVLHAIWRGVADPAALAEAALAAHDIEYDRWYA